MCMCHTVAMELVNTTCTFRVDRRFDLCALAIEEELLKPDCQKAKKNKSLMMKGFKAVAVTLIRNGRKKVTALVYNTGSVVLVGAASMAQAQEAERLFTSRFYCSVTENLQQRNCVFHVKLGHRVHLSDTWLKAKSAVGVLSTSYEPELFPAVVVSSSHGKATIFASGHMNITGCTSLTSAESLYRVIIAFLINKV